MGIRAFIAIDIDKSLSEGIRSVSREVSDTGITTPVKEEQMHFTLFFFEDLTDKQISLVQASMRIAKRKRFNITMKGLDFFMHRNDPQVVFIGIEHSDELVQLHTVLNRALREAGFTTETRPFSPHLTLARVKSSTNPEKRERLLALRPKYSGKEFGSFPCKSIILRKSTLKPNGPVYEDIYKVDFQ